ncbi:LANO_0D10352g1_1 [Lachancea nothofagi CBS 11611]|uniref:CBK1 kinase activator protein MOB2 n=1 Tax=Lachancea nothofagi CBS 11611 TaxID=1266666 RepID=A0A1G4JK71_9SACH|nr:LANO_0D10352g1_1 [Lachancea nothofagi CBS 11611]
MSFFNTFKGFGRSSKKNKSQHVGNSNTPVNSVYSNSHSSNSKLSLRQMQMQSPGRHSPARHSATSHNNNNHGGGNGNDGQQAPAFQPSNAAAVIPERPETQQALFLSEPFVRTALVKGSFKTIVQLPKYVDLGEWVALNIFEFYTNLNQFYGIVAEYVTADAYPTMNAGPHTDYMWLDANNRQVSLPAGQYIDLALTWINNKVSDQVLFPTQNGYAFPPNFVQDIQRILIQMFRIFAHMYHHHFDKIIHLSLEAHWNSLFAHFISFAKEYNLVDRKDMYPLGPLIENLEKQGKII